MFLVVMSPMATMVGGLLPANGDLDLELHRTLTYLALTRGIPSSTSASGRGEIRRAIGDSEDGEAIINAQGLIRQAERETWVSSQF